MKQILVVVLAAAVIIAGCVGQAPETGGITFKVTDAAVNVTSFQVTVASIDVHMATAGTEKAVNETTEGEATNETSTSGWLTVITGPLTVDLVSVKDILSILGEANLTPGIYTQIRMRVESATAVLDNQTVNVTVPSGAIKFVHPFRIEANKTTSVIIDFDADRSLVLAGGKYIFRPAVKTLTEFSAATKSVAEDRKQRQADDANLVRQERTRSGEHGRPINITETE